MLRLIFKTLFKITGWSIEGGLRPDLKKCVIVIAPHTSFWDYYIAVVSRGIGRFRASYLVKSELFKVPFVGWFLKITGGIPVDRKNKNNNLVDSIVRSYRERSELILALTPEGTRKKVTTWKTGFYRIALAADVPLVLVSFDFSQKVVRYLEEFHPTGDMDEDINYIMSLYRGVPGKYPDQGV